MATSTGNRARLAEIFHALSDETRLSIVQRLRRGECCVCELTDLLGAAQSRLSFHLKVLRKAGLIDCRREGRWAYYWLVPEALGRLEDAIGDLKPTRAALAQVEAGRACCA
ncbi:MAG TPA: metalloregulator ArsR/SmtB family transcription factor [Gemmatimonadales bacterium]|nr:metalloregulator ArsR/SmtB family transcription factor [Gemmatimonadales bacterium]